MTESMVINDASGSGAVSLQAAFTQLVHKHHAELLSRGMNPNEACALALRAAAGQVSMPDRLSDIYAALDQAQHSKDYSSACKLIRTFFASPDAVYASFWPQQHQHQPSQDKRQQNGLQDSSSSSSSSQQQPSQPSSSSTAAEQQQPYWLQIDAAAVQELHDRLQACHSEAVRDALMEGGQQLLLHISDCYHQCKDNPGFCRQVCGLLANPWLQHMECQHLLAALSGVLVELSRHGSAFGITCGVSYAQQLRQLLQTWQASDMRRVVALLQQYITLTLYHHQAITSGVQAATEFLGLIEAAASATGVLDMKEFYNDAVNEPDFNIKEDYKRWANGNPIHFSFCSFPWIYDPASKSRILQLENQMQQLVAFEDSMMKALMGNPREACPFLLIKVRRGKYLLRDTLMQINSAKNNGSLKKPLKIKFIGEEGVDEGGVQKEFFQLLVRECFNPEFGMFVYSEETHLHWFHASSMDLDTEFQLIGILIGLAIYNSHILQFQFPLVLYKKLMGQQVGLDDLQELHPDVHRSLNKLLQMGEEELAGLGLTFQLETEGGFGERVTVDLIPNGGQTPVTAANVQQYVEAHTKHLLVDSISRQFTAFQRGFLKLCSGKALQFFRPAELEQLVCGGRVVDLSALEAATQYDDGYTVRSTPIRWFWEVVHSLDDAQQKRLLFFITGSDRVPIKGLGHLSPQFVISRNGNDSSRLPTAHTCFNHLLLPAYKDKETMRARLLLAIENAEGFGLL